MNALQEGARSITERITRRKFLIYSGAAVVTAVGARWGFDEIKKDNNSPEVKRVEEISFELADLASAADSSEGVVIVNGEFVPPTNVIVIDSKHPKSQQVKSLLAEKSELSKEITEHKQSFSSSIKVTAVIGGAFGTLLFSSRSILEFFKKK